MVVRIVVKVEGWNDGSRDVCQGCDFTSFKKKISELKLTPSLPSLSNFTKTS